MEKPTRQSDSEADFEWLVDIIFTPTIVLIIWVILCTFTRLVRVSC